MLLCELIRDLDANPPPGGWQNDAPNRAGGWMDVVEGHAARLWHGTQVGGVSMVAPHDYWASPRAVCAGYRYLTSLPSCPRSMRMPMHRDLFARRETG